MSLPVMPFSAEVSERTKLMALDTWLGQQIKERHSRLAEYQGWTKEKREGYEQGIIDMALDVKNKLKDLGK